jgi:3-oxoacyl-[acyl-carrier-protein] synthase-1
LTTPPRPIRAIGIRAWTATTAAGIGLDPLAVALAEHRSALRRLDDPRWPIETFVGRVDALDGLQLPAAHRHWDCRVNRLAWLGLQADGFADAVGRARARHGAARVGLVLGTSASTIAVSEEAYRRLEADGGFPPAMRDPRLNTPHAVAEFLQQALGLEGPCATVSTACSSSAKAFASAERWLRLGWVDAVVVAGVEAIGASLFYGFRALGLVSPEPCRPFDARRSGISIGEAAGYALLDREAAPLQLLGYGESNDAHHMSSPHPQGLGAEAALDDALARAGVEVGQIDFVNLHGTASERNDDIEAALVARRYPAGVHACATKGLTGHAMGAAGIVEAAICLLALEGRVLAGTAQTEASDPALGERFAAQLALQPRHGRSSLAASHSFGFGGNNAVLVFGRRGA